MSHVPGHRHGGATPAEDLSISLNQTLGNEVRATSKMPNSMALSFVHIKTFKKKKTLFLCRSKSWSLKRKLYRQTRVEKNNLKKIQIRLVLVISAFLGYKILVLGAG